VTDLPQVVVGMAVTRKGIPVRVSTFPGNASDQGDHPQGQGRPARLEPLARASRAQWPASCDCGRAR
jgi:hypothetical protein